MLRLLARARACSARDHLMILLSFQHGLRASEITHLTPKNFADGFLTVQRLKGSLRTTQALAEDTNPLLNERALIADFIAGMHEDERLFPVRRETFWRRVQRHAKAIGLPAHKRNTKMFKHSIALQAIKAGVGIQDVRQFLGHKSLSSTGEYLRVSDEEAGAAVRRALKD